MKPVSSNTGPPPAAISASTAQSTQSSSSAATLPCGFRFSTSFDEFDSDLVMNFIGEFRFSRSIRRVPAHIACRCSAGVSSSRTATDAPSSTSAGYALTSWPRCVDSNTCGSEPNAGFVSPAFSSVLAAFEIVSRTFGASFRCSAVDVLALGHALAALVDHPERHLQVLRHRRQVPVRVRHRHPAQRTQLAAEHLQQRTVRRGHSRKDVPGRVRRRDEVAAQRLRQRLDQLR